MMGTTTMTQEGIQSLKGALFTMVAENFFPPLYGIIDHIPKQMPVFLREYTNDINSPLIFYLSNVISLVRMLYSIALTYHIIEIFRFINYKLLFLASRIFCGSAFLLSFNVRADTIKTKLVCFYLDDCH